jgi:hypothetical protein
MVTIATSEDALKMVEEIYWRLWNRRGEIDKQESYNAGNQNLQFASSEWLRESGSRYAGFSDNWCASVVNAVGERTKVTGIKLRGDDPKKRDSEADKRAMKLWDQWNLNEMDAQSSAGFLTSFIAKRSYVLVWGDGENAQITWEHPANVEIQYDWMNPRKRLAALKTWVDEDTEYATLYTPEFLWKFQRARVRPLPYQPQSVQMEQQVFGPYGIWKPREGKGEVWPLPNPMGVVPIVEVPNRPMLRGEPQSEIDGVMPKQDAINLLWAYLFFAADYASMPARVLLGSAPPMRKILDAVGGEVGVEPVDMPTLSNSRFAVFSGEHAKVAQWDAAKLDVFTDVINILVGHIASQTRTPPTYLVSLVGLSNVNADGLKAAEIGLVKKELEFQTFATPRLREVQSLTALATGDKALAEEVRLSTIVWMNPEIRSEAQLADALLKKRQMGYPLEYLMELDGVDPYDMQRIQEMLEAENQSAMGMGVQAALNNTLNQPDAPADGPPADEPTV